MYTKVFVGNLSFKTKADELAAEFSAAGRVVSANIITRGPRSLGYGFVEMESDEDARKAVNLLNKRSVDGREINVEVAKPRDEAKIAEKRAARASRPRRGRGGRGGAAPAEGEAAASPAAAAPADGAARGRRPRRARGGNAGAGAATPAADGASTPSGARGPRRRRAPRQDNANRALSNNTLFVANLPFSLDDAGLTALFKDLKVTKGHVVKNRSGRSKGFGFVEFASEADQKAALAASEKLTAEQRQLIVKVALSPPEGLVNASESKDTKAEATK